ncbi:MAG: hypothetical protein Q4B29_00835 [Candidatus Saccharibacteria bacterium]|nr:hypothetical protein [Candidatus Saccharibacteria bacterium]
MAVFALAWGIINILVINKSDYNTFSNYCFSEAYFGGDQAITYLCRDEVIFFGHLFNEIKVVEVMLMFVTCIVLTLFAFSYKKNK